MYNSNLKQRYFDESESRNLTLSQYKVQFERIASEEELLNKDMCEFTTKEILDYYKKMCTSSFDFLNCINSQFKLYAAWCQTQGLLSDNQNHYDEINRELLMSCINYGLSIAKIVTREQLLQIIKEFKNPSDKFICLALYEGLFGKEFTELADLYLSDFDGNMVTLSTGRVLEVSDELIKYAAEAANTYEYIPYNINGKCDFYPCSQSDGHVVKVVITRNNFSDKVQGYTFSIKLKTLKRYYGYECISGNALKESGRIEMIQKICKDENIDPKTCLIRHPEIEYRYGKLNSRVAYIDKYSDFLKWE